MSLTNWQTHFVHAVQTSESDGHSVYHNNFVLTQRASLATTFPTVLAMLGEDTFASAAHQYFLRFGKESFDWGEYGAHFPTFLDQQNALSDYPYIAEVAQYELVVHQVNRLPNKTLNQASVGLLQTHPWHEIYFDFAPGLQLLPLVFDAPFIVRAHAEPEALTEDFFQQPALQVDATYLIWRPELATQIEQLNDEYLGLWQFVLNAAAPNLQEIAQFSEQHQLDLMPWLHHLMQHKQLFRCYSCAKHSRS